MGKTTTSFKIDEETKEELDRILQVKAEVAGPGLKPERQELIEDLLKEWIDENRHYLDMDADDIRDANTNSNANTNINANADAGANSDRS